MTDATGRAEHAKRLMEDPMLVEAFASVVREAMNDWANTPEHAVDKREGLWRMVQTIHRVKNVLMNHMATGKMVEAPPITRV